MAAATLGGSELVRAGGGALGALGIAPQAAAAAAIGEGLRRSTKAAIDFESSIADVRKVLGGDGGLDEGQLAQLSDEIIKLSTTDIPIAAEGIASIVAAAGQAGIGGELLGAGDVEGAREEILQFTESAAKVGVAFDISAEEAGTALSKLRTGLGLSQNEVEGLAGTINVLSNSLPATAAEILDVEKRVGALAQSAGVSKEETAGLAAALIGAGAPSNIAATAIKNLTLSLGAGEAATDKQRNALAELGLTAEQAAEQLQKDAGGLIERTFARISEFAPEQQVGLITELVGKESVGAIGPLLGNLDQLRQAFTLAADSNAAAISVQKEFESRSNTTANRLQILKNRLTAVAISIGDEVLPFIEDLFKGLDSGKFDDLGTAAAAAFRAVLKGIVAVKNAIAPFYEGLSKAVGDDFPAFGEAGGRVVESLSRLFESLNTTLDQFFGKVDEGQSGLERLGSFVGGALLSAFELLADVVEAVADGVTATSDAIGEFASGNFTAGFQRIGNALFEFVVEPLNAVVRQVIALADAIGAGGAIPDALREFSARQGRINGSAEDPQADARAAAQAELDAELKSSRDAEANGVFGGVQTLTDSSGGSYIVGSSSVAGLRSSAAARAAEVASNGAPAITNRRRRQGGKGRGRRGGRGEKDIFADLDASVRGVLDRGFKRDARSRARSQRRGGGPALSDLDVLSRGVLEANRSKGIERAGGGGSGRSAGVGPTVYQTINNYSQTIEVDARGQPSEAVGAINRAADALGDAGSDIITGVTKAVTFLNNQAGRRTR